MTTFGDTAAAESTPSGKSASASATTATKASGPLRAIPDPSTTAYVARRARNATRRGRGLAAPLHLEALAPGEERVDDRLERAPLLGERVLDARRHLGEHG